MKTDLSSFRNADNFEIHSGVSFKVINRFGRF
jgi:hypothetical protein